MAFYKTELTLTILSDTPVSVDGYKSLIELAHAMDNGDVVGRITTNLQTVRTRKQINRDLLAVGSSPEFFGPEN